MAALTREPSARRRVDGRSHCELIRAIEQARGALLWVALRSLGNAEDAEDAVGRTALAAWRRREELDPKCAQAWLFGALRHSIGAELRSRERVRSRVERVGREPASASAETSCIAAYVELRAAVRALPEAERVLIWLTYWEGLPSTEVARALGCSPEAVRTRLARCRKRLRAEIEYRSAPEDVRGRRAPR